MRAKPAIHRGATGALGAALLALLAGCSVGPGGAAGPSPGGGEPGGEPAVAVETVAEGLDAPWSIAFAGDVAHVSERDTGRIVQIEADGGVREVGRIPGAAPRGEGGLLGIAVRDGRLYAYATTRDDNRIVRHELVGATDAPSLGPGETILSGLPSAGHHNGGRIAFGPDGMLYATVGDAGDPASAQDLDALSGKILRMTPDGGVPADNPFPGSLVYSSGHRNPQGIAWAEDGAMYASEFGQNTWDELNAIEPGRNYGWPEVEGIAGAAGFVDPLQQWPPSDASPSGIAISGGAIHVANLRGERLRAVPLSEPATATERFVHEYGRLRDVAEAPDGSLWVLTNNTDGRGSPAAGDDRILRLPAG